MANHTHDSASLAGGPEEVSIPAPGQFMLSEEEVERILSGFSGPDHFAVLRRRGHRPLSEEQIVQILQESGAGPSGVTPLPLAQRMSIPPAALPYRGRPGHPHDLLTQVKLSRLPLPYRILRVGLWLTVAAVLAAVILHSIPPR